MVMNEWTNLQGEIYIDTLFPMKRTLLYMGNPRAPFFLKFLEVWGPFTPKGESRNYFVRMIQRVLSRNPKKYHIWL